MKKISLILAAVILILTVTSCTADNNYEAEKATSAVTTVKSEKQTDSITTLIFDEAYSEDTITEASSENATPQSETEATTKKSESTTKQLVTTTNPATTSSSSGKLPSYSPQPEALALFNQINSYRTQNGLAKLTLDSALCKMAYIRAQEQNKLKGHDRPDGTKYYSILDEYDYEYSGCGENVAFGNNVTVIGTFERWKDSTTHNANMLEGRWTKAGIAMYINADGGYNLVILFAC